MQDERWGLTEIGIWIVVVLLTAVGIGNAPKQESTAPEEITEDMCRLRQEEQYQGQEPGSGRWSFRCGSPQAFSIALGMFRSHYPNLRVVGTTAGPSEHIPYAVTIITEPAK